MVRALALVVALAGAAVSAVSAAAAPDVSHFTLANGLQVVVVPDHRAPVVTHMIWYKVGSADETPGKSGLAHFLEHLRKIPAMRSRATLPQSAAKRTRSPAATTQPFSSAYRATASRT